MKVKETMDNKSWLWRKKSSQKTIISTNKFGISFNEEFPMASGGGPVRSVARNLNEKLASVLLDSHGKDDDPVKQHENLTQDGIGGQQNVEPEVICLRKEQDEASDQEMAENEKRTVSDSKLEKCMQELIFLQEQQEQKINDAVMKAKAEFEIRQKNLEEKLTEKSKKVATLTMENTNLSKALAFKEKLVEEMHKNASEAEAEFNALMGRLDSTEKENTFLRYEFHMLEKEVEVRNEELEYTRQSADVSHRQNLESVRKISKLEAECQRLRVLMRKKLPGPAALSKLRNEVEILGKDQINLRRKPNPTLDLVLSGAKMERSPEIPVKNINFLIEQLRGMEEENRTLKEVLGKKNDELRSTRIMYSRTASRLSQIEIQMLELSGSKKCIDLAKLKIPFDIGSDDGVSSSGSWANALISELENFKDERLKTPSEPKSDISLMDDFTEMEKLALASSTSTDNSLSACKELIPIEKQEQYSKDESFDWLQEVLNAIFKQQRISERSVPQLLEDIKIALGYVNQCSKSVQSNLQEENKKLKDELEAMEAKTTTLMKQVQESEKCIENLQIELETTKESKEMIEDQMENHKCMNEDLDTQLTVTKAKMNELIQKLSSLEVELEEKNNCCEELEATCLELQLQLESVAKKESINFNIDDDGMQSQNSSDITAASLKLAECQETILNLGKQFKALATPREGALFDKVINTSGSVSIYKSLGRRFSLRDRMIAEDTTKAIILRSPVKDANSHSDNNGNALTATTNEESDSKQKPDTDTAVGTLAIVPVKKQGVGLLRRLLMRRKKGNSIKSKSLSGKV